MRKRYSSVKSGIERNGRDKEKMNALKERTHARLFADMGANFIFDFIRVCPMAADPLCKAKNPLLPRRFNLVCLLFCKDETIPQIFRSVIFLCSLSQIRCDPAKKYTLNCATLLTRGKNMVQWEYDEKCGRQILLRLRIDNLYIKDYTENNLKRKEKDNAMITIQECDDLSRRILRNELTHCIFFYPKKFRLSFGFDYYMYISCNLRSESMRKILTKYNLYCE